MYNNYIMNKKAPLTNYQHQVNWRLRHKDKHKEVNLKYRMKYYYWKQAIKELLRIDPEYFLC